MRGRAGVRLGRGRGSAPPLAAAARGAGPPAAAPNECSSCKTKGEPGGRGRGREGVPAGECWKRALPREHPPARGAAA